MLALAHSAAMQGVDGYVVRVEADSSPGTPAFSIIGLPDRALGESRDRVRAAIFNSGLLFPSGKLLINLAPADVRKEGPGFDLSLALALLSIDEQIDRLALQGFVALGELALGRDASRERTGSCRRRSAPAMRGSIRLPFRVRTRGTMLDPCN